MTLKGDAKLKRKLTLRTFVNLHARSRKPENLHFKVSDEKVQKSYLSWHWKVIQSLKKNLTFCLKNEIRNFVNFNSSSGETENLHFDGLLLPKECNVWPKTIHTSCVVKNNLWFQKWYKKFGEFSHTWLKVI